MKAVEDFGIPDGRLRSSINPPPRPEFGELSSSICFDIARERGGSPKEIAGKVLGKIDYAILRYVLRVEEAGGGYVNFHLDYDRATPRILTEVLENSCEYGYVKAKRPLRVVVEHTSVNPVHAIHIGQARNTVLGDSIARILKARGHSVKTRYYVDDMGRQSAILAYGYLKLGNGEVEGKIDHFLGSVYSLTNCILEVKSLKRRIEETQPEQLEELNRLRARLDEWVSIAAELQEKHPSLFEKLTTLIEDDAETQVGMLIRDYEQKKPSAVEAIRRVSALCLEGFKETLRKLEVEFDSWDWESDLVWSSVVGKILEELKRTGYVREVEGVLELESERIVDDFNLREKLQLTERYSLPPLTLARSDGTTLYTLRDIAYTLRKFEEADRVINVIGAEQRLAQIHVKAALYALGKHNYADNLTHFAFGLVEMPGYKMSSRRGRLVTLDSVITESVKRAELEVEKRSEKLREDEKRKIAETIAISAVKYALVSVDPSKTVVFTWDRVLSLEKNSAPFINYAYTRAVGILNKAPSLKATPDFKLLRHPLEKALILRVAMFPEVFEEAAEKLRPENLATYSNELAEIFHEYYEKVNVIRAENEDLRSARTGLVRAVKIVLENAMSLLGVNLTPKM